MKSNYKNIGDHIREVNVRNRELRTNTLLGINIDKYYMLSVANIVGTDMTAYKVVKQGQFACNRMHVGRDKRLPVALSNKADEFIVSPAYDVFEIIDEKELLPEYLMMWFSRTEFDRNAWFFTDADVRGGLPWKSFCDLQLPIPKPDKQKEIIKEYHTIVSRISLNNQLIQKLEETAQTIYKQWFVDFEFPNEEGKPYKSNGGEMVESELGKIPKKWRVGKIKDIAEYSVKKISIKNLSLDNYISTENMLQNRQGVTKIDEIAKVESVTQFKIGDILISNIRPYFKKIWLAAFDGGCSNDVLCFQNINKTSPEHLYYILETDTFFSYVMAGCKGTKMPRGDKKWIMQYPIVLADERVFSKCYKILKAINASKNSKRKEIALLTQMTKILLSKLATIEN